MSISEELLGQLDGDDSLCGPWAPVISDIAAQYAARHELLARLDAHPHDRFARARLAVHLAIRDRTGLGIGCRRSASRSPLDHTVDHADGGLTTRDNLGCFCGLHHGYKTKGWWRLVRVEPGHFEWTSPLKHTYRTRCGWIEPPTVLPLPCQPASDSNTRSTTAAHLPQTSAGTGHRQRAGAASVLTTGSVSSGPHRVGRRPRRRLPRRRVCQQPRTPRRGRTR